ncbi:MAG: YdeI/OmpD-associated family protein, partial [Actinomycetes bacterium]
MGEAYERLEVTSAAQLRTWLEAHHADTPGIWLVTWKKKADPAKHVTYEEVVREVLCFGWIDSQARALD